MRYAAKKIYSWSNDLAYVAGLFTADGNLSGDQRHLNITSKDIEIIGNVKEILQLRTTEKIKKGAFGTSAYYIQFSDTALYDFLSGIGLRPKKSLTIASLRIPDKYFADFLRGLFDGDGTVYGYKDERWPSSFMYYVGFASGSSMFLLWLKETISRLYKTTGGTIQKNIRAETLVYAKSDSRRLFRAMYRDTSAPKLGRKYEKFIAFLAEDPYPKV